MDSYDVTVDEELGEIQLVKIEKRKYWLHDDWYLKYITLKTPHGDYIEFPCYRWITGEGEIVLRDGRGKIFRPCVPLLGFLETRKSPLLREPYFWV